MYYQNKKNSTIPKEWFFFNPENLSDSKKLSYLSKNVGVIFFNKNLNVYDFLKKIEPCIEYCRKKKIKFIGPFSNFWCSKYHAFGMMIEISKKSKKFHSKKKKP